MGNKIYWTNKIKRDPCVVFTPPLKIRGGEGVL